MLPGRPETPPSRVVAVRLGAPLFWAGALITLAAVALPHPPQLDERAYLVLSAVQALVATALWRLPRVAAGDRLPVLVAACGILVVTAAGYFGGERLGGPPLLNELFYVWPALYSGYFFGRRALAVAVATVAVAHYGVLTATVAAPETALTRWLITMAVVAGVAAAAHALRLHVDRLLDRLRDAMRTDPLTGILNRRGFEEAFAAELGRCRRDGDPLAVLLGDVDRFKAINDRFGHAAGDAALTAIARTLRSECRTMDVVARIGGEEFAVLMPGTSLEAAAAVADRLRGALSRTTDPAGAGVSMSFGVTTCRSPGEADPDRLLGAADAALYAAKAGGRDRTVTAQPGTVSASVAASGGSGGGRSRT